MTGSRDRHHRRSHSSDSSSSSSSSSSSDKHSESNIECYSNEKECKKKDCKKRDYKKKYCKKKDRKHKYHSSSESSSSSSCSSSNSEHKFDVHQIYQYFKNQMVLDEQLMLAGSSAYIFSGNKENQSIPLNHSLKLSNSYINYQIEKTHDNSPYYVREDGIYLLFLCMSTDSSSQLTVFINGLSQPLNTIGTNSGSGQLISRQLLALKKDDNVVIRNYTSLNTITSQTKAGGLVEANDIVIILVKVAPLTTPKENWDELKCLSHKKLKLFKNLTKKLVADSELMVKGFNVTGTFSNTIEQIINTESDIVFGSFQNVNGLQWNPSNSNPEQVKVLEDGIYKLFFVCNTHTPAQFSICVNGIPDETTTTGSNKGASQISLRCILTLKKDDIITIRNHISANGSITISANAGGFQPTVNVLLTVFKIANITRPEIIPVDCKIEKKFHCYYEQYRNYLLCKKWLQIDGSKAYLDMVGSSPQKVNINNALSFSTNTLIKNMVHQQGKSYLTIEKSGIYDIFVDTITNEPDQWTLFINGNPDLSTVFGRESGAARTIMRQFIKLNKDDVVEVRNYQSHSGTITSSINPGGSSIGNNKQFMLFLLTPTCDDDNDNKKCMKDTKCKK